MEERRLWELTTAKSKLNFAPTSDDRPSFFDFRKGVHESLLIVLAGALVLGMLLMRPAWKKHGLRRESYYFVGLRLGFMLIEIPLIQKFALILGHPTRSFLVLLLAVLTGAGLESLPGRTKYFRWRSKRYWPLAVVPVWTGVVALAPGVAVRGGNLGLLPVRVLFSASLLFPLGFFMGMPFPLGTRTLDLMKKKDAVPLMWAINGTMSMAGSVLAMTISTKLGLSFSLGLGAAIYVTLFLAMPLSHKGREAT